MFRKSLSTWSTASIALLVTLGSLPASETGGQKDLIIKGHTSAVQAVAFSPDGKLIATGSDDKTIRVWDVATGDRQSRIPYQANVYALAFTPDGKTILAGGKDGIVTFWDTASGEKQKSVTIGKEAIGFLAISPDGKTFAIINVGGRSSQIRSVETGSVVASIKGHDLAMNMLAYSPDSLTIATVGDDASVRIWSTTDGKELDNLKAHDGYVRSVTFSPDGKRLATCGADKTVIMWDVKTGNVMKPVMEGHSGTVVFLAFQPDGRLLSRTTTGETFAWTAGEAKPTKLTKGIGGGLLVAGYTYPTDVALSPDGKLLAIATDKDVRLHKLVNGK